MKHIPQCGMSRRHGAERCNRAGPSLVQTTVDTIDGLSGSCRHRFRFLRACSTTLGGQFKSLFPLPDLRRRVPFFRCHGHSSQLDYPPGPIGIERRSLAVFKHLDLCGLQHLFDSMPQLYRYFQHLSCPLPDGHRRKYGCGRTGHPCLP